MHCSCGEVLFCTCIWAYSILTAICTHGSWQMRKQDDAATLEMMSMPDLIHVQYLRGQSWLDEVHTCICQCSSTAWVICSPSEGYLQQTTEYNNRSSNTTWLVKWVWSQSWEDSLHVRVGIVATGSWSMYNLFVATPHDGWNCIKDIGHHVGQGLQQAVCIPYICCTYCVT